MIISHTTEIVGCSSGEFEIRIAQKKSQRMVVEPKRQKTYSQPTSLAMKPLTDNEITIPQLVPLNNSNNLTSLNKTATHFVVDKSGLTEFFFVIINFLETIRKSANQIHALARYMQIYGCAVSRLYVDSTTTTSCVTHSMLIGIETCSEVKLC